MKRIVKRSCLFLLAAVLMLFTGCQQQLNPEDLNFVIRNEDGQLEIIRVSENLTYYSSDKELETFLNDFYSRHIRAGEKSIGIAKMGACWSYAKEWEALALSWFDSTALALEEYDADALMRKYVNSIDIDKFGNAYVWFNDENFGPYARPERFPWDWTQIRIA